MKVDLGISLRIGIATLLLNAGSPAAQPEATPLISEAPLHEQRQQAWRRVERLTLLPGTVAAARSWHFTEDVFAPAKESGTSLPTTRVLEQEQSGEPQIVIFTMYNEVAFLHIRNNKLYQPATLDRLRESGTPDVSFADNRTIPIFPDDSAVLLTAWWPIARHGSTALPVWDPHRNPHRKGGNNYMTWERAVAVCTECASNAAPFITFAGRNIATTDRISLEAFQHITVDAALARQLAVNDLTRKASSIALGRSIEAGDYLILVAMHVAEKQSKTWRWSTLWWHDRPSEGPFAADRPAQLSGPWRNYLLDITLDTECPIATDCEPKLSFNPWLEARFPDAGSGGGTRSDCIACHQRASHPARNFLPVTHGAPDPVNDPAFAAGQLRTDFIWSLPRQAAKAELTKQ